MFHSKPEDNRSKNDLLRTLLSPDMEKERYICSLALLSDTYLDTIRKLIQSPMKSTRTKAAPLGEGQS
jgi:hypothetical protein